MRKILLTGKNGKNKFVLVDDADFDWLNQFKWQARKKKNTFYAVRSAWLKDERKYKNIWMHREIMKTPRDMLTDHRDGNGLNNQHDNLRIVSHGQNQWNQRKAFDNTSGFKGVVWRKNRRKWIAQIVVKGKHIFLGLFKEKIDAAKAYDQAAIKYFGEYAHLNFPRSVSF